MVCSGPRKIYDLENGMRERLIAWFSRPNLQAPEAAMTKAVVGPEWSALKSPKTFSSKEFREHFPGMI
jgi:hypothetical protein